MGRRSHGSRWAHRGSTRTLAARVSLCAAHRRCPCAVRGRDGCGRTTRRSRGARDCGEGSVRRVERGAGCGGGEIPRILAGEPASANGGRAVVAAEKRGRGHSARGLDPKVLHERALSRLHRQYERRIGLALAPVRKGLPGSYIRGAEPLIICVDAMDWMGRCRRRTRSHYAYRHGKLCHWRRRPAEADGE